MVLTRLTIELPGPTGPAIAGFVDDLTTRCGLTPIQAYRLRLAADELVTNIAHHGYGGRPGTVELTGGTDGDKVWLRVVDDAEPFDPSSHDPGPRLDAGPAQGPEGGFGLFIALTAVDGFVYRRANGQNRSTLTMRRP